MTTDSCVNASLDTCFNTPAYVMASSKDIRPAHATHFH